MAVYLSYLEKPKHAQQMIESSNFKAKHKITINNPVQTHYTVQGVQTYSSQQIVALRQKGQRLLQGRQGSYAPLRVMLLSDQLIDCDEPQKSKQKSIKYLHKNKQRPNTANRQKVKTNARNAVSANNQTIVKLEKQVGKRNSLQQKLQKMSDKYKQYFKDIDLKEGLIESKNKENESEEEDDDDGYEHRKEGRKNKVQDQQQTDRQQQQGQENVDNESEKIEKTTYHRSRKDRKVSKIEEEQQWQLSEEHGQQQTPQTMAKPRLLSARIQRDPVKDCTSYSQMLGTAINQMFK